MRAILNLTGLQSDSQFDALLKSIKLKKEHIRWNRCGPRARLSLSLHAAPSFFEALAAQGQDHSGRKLVETNAKVE
jgi:hypothetical protein